MAQVQARSTFVTLVFIPALYLGAHDLLGRFKRA